MFVGTGRSACMGVCYGNIFYIPSATVSTADGNDTYLSVSDELEIFHKAIEKTQNDLEQLYNKTLESLGEEKAEIFSMHLMMLSDPDISGEIENRIKKGAISAYKATLDVGIEQAREFEQLDDPYMKERAADIKDVTQRLAKNISGTNSLELTSPSVIVADDLSPSQTVGFDRKLIIGFVLKKGSLNSHASILARTLNIPTLIGANLPDENLNNKTIAIDAVNGKFYLEPDTQTLDFIIKQKDEFYTRQLELLKLRGVQSVTQNGQKVLVCANIGRPDDVEMVLENDAEGIGLFRSEFLYLDKDDFPTEKEQFLAYSKVAQAMKGKPVIIRTLDIGADKQAYYFNLPKEENPAMGLRAIRISLTRPEIFKTQIRAILRANTLGNIMMMLPMIISVNEILKAKEIINIAAKELDDQAISYKMPKIGIMIETPAAVVIANELAKHVDFFSIGTNDLTQYTLAIDRQNKDLGEFYDPHHPAILAMIEQVARAAHKHGVIVGICGELASDLTLTDTFIKMGIDELSVSPSCVLALREKVLKSQVHSDNVLDLEILRGFIC